MEKLTPWMIMKAVFGMGMVILTMFLCASFGYWVSPWIADKLGFTFSLYGRFALGIGLGIFMMIAIGSTISLLTRSSQNQYWDSITEAMIQISRGDFELKLGKQQNRGPMNKIVQGLHEMADGLKQLETMRQQFVSDVSHEIQSPLTSINGFAHLLLNEPKLSADEQRHYIGIIEEESKRLSSLSENLLRLSSLESESYPFEPVSYRLDTQLKKVILACEPHWLANRIEMNVELPETTIVADPALLNQVWTNLIHNALKFTPAGGSIAVTIQTSGTEAAVRFADTGIGIDEQDKQRIFERFYKVDRSRNRSAGGSGLGLSIVHNIIDKHNGRITVDSVPGEGTTFAIHLDLQGKSIPLSTYS